jgi:hypothetical protein
MNWLQTSFFTVICLFVGSLAQADGDHQVDKNVLEILSQNYSKCNTMTLEWESLYTSDMSQSQLLQRIKFPEFYGFDEPIYMTYLWDNGKFYFQRKHKENPINKLRIDGRLPNAWEILDGADLQTRVDEGSFDGVKYYSGNGLDVSGTSAGIAIQGLESVHKTNYRILEDGHYTNYIGFKFPKMTVEVGEGHDSFIIHLIRNSEILDASWNVVKGQRQYLIRCKTKNDWDAHNDNHIINVWLLPDYNYAIGQYDIQDTNGKLKYRVINNDFQKLTGTDVYLPYRTVAQYYTFATISGDISSKELFRATYRLVNASARSVKPSLFNLQDKYAKPGTHVADHTLKDTEYGLQYVYPANPADLDRVIESALTGKDFVPTPIQPTWMFILRLILCVAGTAMALYGGYLKFIKKPK